jgi:flagellar basal body-associated protein FliL
MTQQSGSEAADSGNDILFVAIGIGLVALSAVVLAAVLWYTVGLATLQSIASPFVLGTVVFTAVVAIVFKKSSDIVDREIAHRGGSGN